MSGEYCTIPNGTVAPGKLLISPTVSPPVPVPMSVATWSTGLATKTGGPSYPFGGAAAMKVMKTADAAMTAISALRDRIEVSYSDTTAQRRIAVAFPL